LEIYKITHIPTGRTYIGKTEKNLAKRYTKQWWKFVENKPLKSDIQLYGNEHFHIEPIYYTLDKVHLEVAEQVLIASHNCIYPKGYNLKPGHRSSAVHEITKRQISETMKNSPLPHRGRFERRVVMSCKKCGHEFYTYLYQGLPSKSFCSRECRHTCPTEMRFVDPKFRHGLIQDNSRGTYEK
jgi:hypothetical protein